MDKKTQINIQPNRVEYNFILGEENGKAIDIDTSNVLAFSIKNPRDENFRVLGIQLRYANGLSDCLIAIKDNNQKSIIEGNVQFSQIGNRTDADITRDELPVNFVLLNKKELMVFVTSKKQKIEPGQVNITLFGKMEP